MQHRKDVNRSKLKLLSIFIVFYYGWWVQVFVSLPVCKNVCYMSSKQTTIDGDSSVNSNSYQLTLEMLPVCKNVISMSSKQTIDGDGLFGSDIYQLALEMLPVF